MGGTDDGLISVQMSSTGRAVGPKTSDLFVDSVILKDRTTGKLYQMYFDGGTLHSVEVTI